jgi:NAD(P)-dependent dehydrogenase (short-subunit alcohol dehydrogenase family)
MADQTTTPPPIVLVTGGSAGIGRATAIELARRGLGVVLTYRTHPDGAAEAVAAARQAGGTAVALPLDLGDIDSLHGFRAALEHVLADEWGAHGLRGLVNNGGFGGGVPFAEITEAEVDRYYQVHFKGPYLLTQSLLPILADGSSIVSTSSSSVRPGDTEPGFSAYAGMKAALITASRYLAKELAPRGIRVNTVSPGPTRTRLGDDGFERFPEIIPVLAGRTALGRIGEPEDIATVIAFLLSDDAAWITGQDIQVSGGFAL